MPSVMTGSPSKEISVTGIAQLEVLDFSRLLCGDPDELKTLRGACENEGFFYLDLRNVNNGRLYRDWEAVRALMGQWFNQPLDYKMSFSNNINYGYIARGTYPGLAKDTRDGVETLKINDDARRASPPVLPDIYLDNRVLLDRFKDACRAVTIDLLTCMSDALGLEGAARFEQAHRSYMPGNSNLSLHCYTQSADPNTYGCNKHTDIGSLTLLFTNQPGLEAMSPRTRLWGRVTPQEGQAVVNIGDTLRFLSGQRFYSAVHRAMPVFREDGEQRLVVTYFLRPEDGATMKDSRGNTITAQEWHEQKETNFSAEFETQANEKLTGGMEEHI
ncbi:2OG-Fe-II oxygenase family oxidoreductase [Xylariales sp. PMI_506]|nr:2OG-Fe-II oxygenase family oxidoreductase [Xylariales sp. PMI_506]